jgi:hypothetical protein
MILDSEEYVPGVLYLSLKGIKKQARLVSGGTLTIEEWKAEQ